MVELGAFAQASMHQAGIGRIAITVVNHSEGVREGYLYKLLHSIIQKCQ